MLHEHTNFSWKENLTAAKKEIVVVEEMLICTASFESKNFCSDTTWIQIQIPLDCGVFSLISP